MENIVIASSGSITAEIRGCNRTFSEEIIAFGHPLRGRVARKKIQIFLWTLERRLFTRLGQQIGGRCNKLAACRNVDMLQTTIRTNIEDYKTTDRTHAQRPRNLRTWF